MTEELLKIHMISGITCKDNRSYQELICSDKDGKEVRIVLPTSHICDSFDPNVGCEGCDKYEGCEVTDGYETDIGRSLLIKR